MKNRTQVGAVTGGVIALAMASAWLSTAAQAGQVGTQPDLVTSQSEFDAEYAAALDRLPFAFPSSETGSDPSKAPDLGEAFAEPGVAENEANLSWLCSWEGEYLMAQQSGEKARSEVALSMIGQWPTLPWVADHFLDPDHGWNHDVLDPARAGDSAGIARDFHNCR
ncbi:hypothetical protein [Subtercola frigoramans]|uniref:Uncharacterized protein n=1 Tax=Subtercola frigoramans TaxID=120298 RepID=A0ABS2L8V2_9MICO|nr:hypothetical protein [Subtercola frigoramans]MBM7473515.1 hypothetical protein [Subtercola frigoramans]